jgi:hypothetical protein
MVSLDLTITVGTIVETIVLGGGGIAAIVTLKNAVVTLKEEVTTTKRENKEQFAGIQTEIKKIGEVLVQQADQNRRIIHLEDDVRELRHGEGFVRGPRGIDREYP